MRYAEIISEKVRPGYLYHACSTDILHDILSSNELEARTSHQVRTLGFDRGIGLPKDVAAKPWTWVNGVSLTRDLHFARKWRPQGAVLVLDGEALKRKFRVLGANYYMDRAESEEFVVGPINPLAPYLVAIQVSQHTYDFCEEEEPSFCKTPKLVVAGGVWDAHDGRIRPRDWQPPDREPSPWESQQDW